MQYLISIDKLWKYLKSIFLKIFSILFTHMLLSISFKLFVVVMPSGEIDLGQWVKICQQAWDTTYIGIVLKDLVTQLYKYVVRNNIYD